MNVSRAATGAFGIAAAIGLLAGCSGGSQSALAPSSGTASGARAMVRSGKVSPTTVKRSTAGAISHGKSWAVKGAAGNSLLYITNTGNGTVTFYAYHNGTVGALAGTLTGFSYPGQPCVDKAGNVYIPDYLLSNVQEYAHGGTTPLQVLVPGGTGCSVDKTTGNLAVANFGLGTVSVYAGGTGVPTTYLTTPYADPEYAAYDNAGNLFIEGNAVPGGFVAELLSGGSTVTNLTLSGFAITFPGNIQWGGTYLLVGDQGTPGTQLSSINQTKVSGTTVTLVNNRVFTGSTDITGYWKRGAPNYAHVAASDYGAGTANTYTFPALSLVQSLGASNGISSPFGATVSP